MKTHKRLPVRPEVTIEEIAEAAESQADAYEEMGMFEDEVISLRADAAERRRLAAIIAEEERAEEAETARLRAAKLSRSTSKKSKKDF